MGLIFKISNLIRIYIGKKTVFGGRKPKKCEKVQKKGIGMGLLFKISKFIRIYIGKNTVFGGRKPKKCEKVQKRV